MTADDVTALCKRLGYLEDGRLKQLDSLQQMELLVESEQLIGAPVAIEKVTPEVFASLDALTRFLLDHVTEA